MITIDYYVKDHNHVFILLLNVQKKGAIIMQYVMDINYVCIEKLNIQTNHSSDLDTNCNETNDCSGGIICCVINGGSFVECNG